mmetsp:Transcript_12224/g.23002  ORF Transcript_12224/g.23002 Transcript_12224/m.23002 type:complete len:227 (+) Transcript_12224:310-990(+)
MVAVNGFGCAPLLGVKVVVNIVDQLSLPERHHRAPLIRRAAVESVRVHGPANVPLGEVSLLDGDAQVPRLSGVGDARRDVLGASEGHARLEERTGLECPAPLKLGCGQVRTLKAVSSQALLHLHRVVHSHVHVPAPKPTRSGRVTHHAVASLPSSSRWRHALQAREHEETYVLRRDIHGLVERVQVVARAAYCSRAYCSRQGVVVHNAPVYHGVLRACLVCRVSKS